MKRNKKLKKYIKKILLLTFIYLILLVSTLTPFMTIEGGNRYIGYGICGFISLIYLLFLMVFIWDYLKEEK